MLSRTMPNEGVGRNRPESRRSSAGHAARVRPRRPGLESLECRRLLAGVVAEYPLANPPARPGAITAGPDDNLWFINYRGLAATIDRITTAGAVTEFPITTAGTYPNDITSGPDGALWFTENTSSGPMIGRITTTGVITQFPVSQPNSGPFPSLPETLGSIAAGPDGALWFTASFSTSTPFGDAGGEIDRITTAGVVTKFAVPTYVGDITSGPDGALWFTGESGFSGSIGRITTAGVVTTFPVAGAADPLSITSGPDGNLWFTENQANKIGRITTAGVVTEFATPTADSSPAGITAGPDGALWFTELVGNKIGKITTAGVVSEFAVPTPNSLLNGIATGSDGDLWFTESGASKIGQLSPAILAPPTVTLVQRFGFHADPTRIVLTFSAPLDPARAQDVRNYRIVGPGGEAVAIDSATYDPAADTVTLDPHTRLNLHQLYKLTVIGTAPGGVADTSGVLLDGAGNGQPGSNYVATLKAADLVLGAEVPGGPARLAALRRTLAKIEADQSKQLARKHGAPKAHAPAKAVKTPPGRGR